jgi:hypothetical protein
MLLQEIDQNLLIAPIAFNFDISIFLILCLLLLQGGQQV